MEGRALIGRETGYGSGCPVPWLCLCQPHAALGKANSTTGRRRAACRFGALCRVPAACPSPFGRRLTPLKRAVSLFVGQVPRFAAAGICMMASIALEQRVVSLALLVRARGKCLVIMKHGGVRFAKLIISAAPQTTPTPFHFHFCSPSSIIFFLVPSPPPQPPLQHPQLQPLNLTLVPDHRYRHMSDIIT